MTALEEGDDAYMIKVGVQDEEFLDPVFIDAEFLKLLEYVWNDIADAPAYDHRVAVSFEKIDPGFLST
jgi:hypothetical protein